MFFVYGYDSEMIKDLYNPTDYYEYYDKIEEKSYEKALKAMEELGFKNEGTSRFVLSRNVPTIFMFEDKENGCLKDVFYGYDYWSSEADFLETLESFDHVLCNFNTFSEEKQMFVLDVDEPFHNQKTKENISELLMLKECSRYPLSLKKKLKKLAKEDFFDLHETFQFVPDKEIYKFEQEYEGIIGTLNGNRAHVRIIESILSKKENINWVDKYMYKIYINGFLEFEME